MTRLRENQAGTGPCAELSLVAKFVGSLDFSKSSDIVSCMPVLLKRVDPAWRPQPDFLTILVVKGTSVHEINALRTQAGSVAASDEPA